MKTDCTPVTVASSYLKKATYPQTSAWLTSSLSDNRSQSGEPLHFVAQPTVCGSPAHATVPYCTDVTPSSNSSYSIPPFKASLTGPLGYSKLHTRAHIYWPCIAMAKSVWKNREYNFTLSVLLLSVEQLHPSISFPLCSSVSVEKGDIRSRSILFVPE